ncbi:MAG: hypothetical protein ABJE47_03490 [bacterium]
MDGRLLTRLTNAGLLAGVGMGVGHLLMPARVSAGMTSRMAFVALVAGTGSLAAWRERRARENYSDERLRGAPWVWLAGGASIALGLAAIAYWLMHGSSN